MKKDNQTLALKISIRKNCLSLIDEPVIMETHAGLGGVWSKVYRHMDTGVAFEKDGRKCESLCRDRPNWSVYKCDSLMAIERGVGFHLPINFFDIDPYGDPWHYIHAVAAHIASRSVIVVNDGMRQKAKRKGAGSSSSLEAVAIRFGNDNIYSQYKEVCHWMMADLCKNAGLTLEKWTSYYCGRNKDMTHYAAVISPT